MTSRAATPPDMVYLDTSVAVAHLLAEDRHPPPEFWSHRIVSSRLLEFELWTRIHARGLEATHGEFVRALLGRVALLELIPEVVVRVHESFPAPVRTLDALHLASLHFLAGEGQSVALASYDARMLRVAEGLGLSAYPLP